MKKQKTHTHKYPCWHISLGDRVFLSFCVKLRLPRTYWTTKNSKWSLWKCLLPLSFSHDDIWRRYNILPCERISIYLKCSSQIKKSANPLSLLYHEHINQNRHTLQIKHFNHSGEIKLLQSSSPPAILALISEAEFMQKMPKDRSHISQQQIKYWLE